jgi:4-hydroxybenzoate polyprenyltransferase
MKFLIYMLRIRRIEFRVAEIPILAIPALLLIRDISIVKTFVFWEGILVFFFLFAFGDMINCLADRDLDAVYKPHLSEAVYGLGVKFVTFQVIASAVIALALAAHVSWQLDRWLLLPLVAVGVVLGAAYSVKPVQLKGRGLLQLFCLWMIIFVGPMLFIGLLVSAVPSVTLTIFAAAYGALQMGIILVNTAEDYPEDKNAGITTTIVALGLNRGISLAMWLTVFGAIGVLVNLAVLFRRQMEHGWQLIALALVAAASAFVITGLVRLKRSIDRVDLGQGIKLVKKAGKLVPLWVTLVAWSTLGAAAVLFYYR